MLHCAKCVGARGGVERESESESIRDWKISNLVSIDGVECAALVGLNKFDRIDRYFFSLIVIGVYLFVWFCYIDV